MFQERKHGVERGAAPGFLKTSNNIRKLQAEQVAAEKSLLTALQSYFLAVTSKFVMTEWAGYFVNEATDCKSGS